MSIFIVITITLNCNEYAYATSLSDMKFLWENKRYKEVLPHLINYRKNEKNGRSVYVSYMIGTSACRIAGKEDIGRKYLNWIKKYYRLTAEYFRVINDEIELCGINSSSPKQFKVIKISLVSGKNGSIEKETDLGFDSECKTSKISDEFVNTSQKFSKLKCFDIFDNDQFVIKNDFASPQEKVNKLLGSHYKVKESSSFIFVRKDSSEENLAGLNNTLERVQDFLVSEYQLDRPQKKITVYYAQDKGELFSLGHKLYGFFVPSGILGYSVHKDLSIVGTQGVGTLVHELFHLLSHQGFEDAPPWIDEGMASLYEASQLRQQRLEGIPNWRGTVLKRNWSARPSIQNLIRMDWETFVKNDRINYATARYFSLYLQTEKLLKVTYSAFRDRDPITAGVDPSTDEIRVLEKVFGKPISQINEDFEKWFNAL
jgi:hypothetical protein